MWTEATKTVTQKPLEEKAPYKKLVNSFPVAKYVRKSPMHALIQSAS